jgi:hypothetical protein
LGVSLRTVYRDVATLIAQGARIEGAPGPGCVLNPGFLLPPLMFTEDEADAVILGLGLTARRGDVALEQAAGQAPAEITTVPPWKIEDARATSGLLAAPAACYDRPASTPEASVMFEFALILQGQPPAQPSPTVGVFASSSAGGAGLWSRHIVEPASQAACGGAAVAFSAADADAVVHQDRERRGPPTTLPPTDPRRPRLFARSEQQ